jgi:hypothetical protein
MGRHRKTPAPTPDAAASGAKTKTERRTFALSHYEAQDLMRYAEAALRSVAAPTEPVELAKWCVQVGLALVLEARALDAEPDAYHKFGPVTLEVPEVPELNPHHVPGDDLPDPFPPVVPSPPPPPPPPPLTDADRCLLRFPAKGSLSHASFGDLPEGGLKPLQELFEKDLIAHAGLTGFSLTKNGEARAQELQRQQSNPLPGGAT